MVSTPLIVTLACHPYAPAVVGQSVGSDVRLTTNGEPHQVTFIRMHDTLTVQRVFKIHGRVGEGQPELMRLRVDSATAGDVDGKANANQPGLVGSIALIPVLNGNPVGFSLERSRVSDAAGGAVVVVVALAAVLVWLASTISVSPGVGVGQTCK